ncbi:di-trans,poly-cis-decaprenylcistransferase [Acetobacter orientalis]|uniref:Di-trans,poly-cis-decaprenylcistransferase n=1 Tax=Acetobacter orientalis TaxID=146474 RepID=A0A2Z5ZFY9_9PROT|nr:di-trans,poly-cis-decaprenylcistransferase [Acetobacter orientalis]
MLWQSAYAELMFLDIFWPDFNEGHFATVLDNYARRERRFGVRPTV